MDSPNYKFKQIVYKLIHITQELKYKTTLNNDFSFFKSTITQDLNLPSGYQKEECNLI